MKCEFKNPPPKKSYLGVPSFWDLYLPHFHGVITSFPLSLNSLKISMPQSPKLQSPGVTGVSVHLAPRFSNSSTTEATVTGLTSHTQVGGGGKPWGKYLRWDGVGRLRGKHAAVVGSVVFSGAKNENKRKRSLWLLGRKRKKNKILNRYSWYNLQASSITDYVMPPEKHDHHQTQQYYCVD